MKIAIYIIIIIGLWTGRHYIKSLIILGIKKFRDRQKQGIEQAKLIDIDSGVIFSPTGTVRTFNISFDIIENGDGKARIIINKGKNDIDKK